MSYQPKRTATEKEKKQRSERNKQKKEEASTSSSTASKKRPTFSDAKPNIYAYTLMSKLLLSIFDNSQTDDIMGYNSVTWLTIIQRFAINITNDEGSDMKLDCWKTSFCRQSTGNLYQQMAIQPFIKDQPIRDQLLMARNCQGVKLETIVGDRNKKKTVSPHRLMCFLGDHENYEVGLTASHRCNNDQCCNPLHLIWEPLETIGEKFGNRSRICCTYGAYDLCPHTPKCIWTKDFKYLPCRNDPWFQCDCNCDCKNIK